MEIQNLLLAFNNYSKLYRRESTIRSYSYILKRFFLEINIEPQSITKKVILNYCVSKENGDVYVRVIGLKRALKQFFIYLNDEHGYKLDLSIFNNIKVREKDYSPQSVLTFADTVKMLKKIKNKVHTFAQRRDLVLILLYATTGMRKSEVVRLNVNDVNLDKRFMNIWHTKTNQPRCVPIPELLIKYLREYLKEREVLAKCDNLMITFSGKPITEACVTSIPQSFKKMYGIKFSFHSFRRGYASDLLYHGADIPSVSKSLGHAKISTTLNYYIYVADKAFKQAVSNHPAYSIDSIDTTD